MALGRAIKEARERRNLTQTQLGLLADVDAATISIMEKRDAKRSVYAAALANALKVSLSELLQGRVVTQGELPLYHDDERINELNSLFERLTTAQQEELLDTIRQRAEESEATVRELTARNSIALRALGPAAPERVVEERMRITKRRGKS